MRSTRLSRRVKLKLKMEGRFQSEGRRGWIFGKVATEKEIGLLDRPG